MALANITNNILTDSGILVTNLTPTTRTLTINGVTYDLSADRSWSIATHDAVTIGTANGLSLSGQVLSLGLASGSANGALSSTDWNTFNNKTSNTGTVTSVGLSSATSGVTIGSTPITTSGTITLAIATASGSQQGLLSSTDWTTFNNKQNALTNPVTGTGTTNYLPKFTGASTIGNSNLINDASGNLGLGVTPANSSYKNIQNGLAVMMGSSADAGAYWNANATFDSGWKYIVNGSSSRYEQGGGGHSWFNAPSGTAGNAISFTQAMTLTAAGRLLINTPTESTYQLDVNGTGRFSGKLIGATAGFSNRVTVGTDSDQPYVALGIFGSISSGADQWSFITDNALSGTSTSTAIMANAKIKASTAVTRAIGINITDAEKGSGATITNNYGLYINNQTAGSTLNYSIYTAGGLHYFGGAATFSSSVTAGGGVYGTEFYNTNGYPYNTLFGSGADATTTTIRAGSTSGYATSIVLGGQNGSPSQTIQFNTSSAERMRITSGGNVLIGTTTSNGYKLEIFNSGVASTDSVGSMYMQTNGGGEGVLAVNTANPMRFFTNGSERMRITSDGNLLINTTTNSGNKLEVNGTARFGSAIVASLGTGLVYSSSGTLTSTNPSDQRLKNTIKPLSYGLNEILQLNPKTFYYNDDVNKDRLKYGFIAQEVQGIMPELARKLNAETDYLGLETEGIYVTLVNAIKEQQNQINELKSQLHK